MYPHNTNKTPTIKISSYPIIQNVQQTPYYYDQHSKITIKNQNINQKMDNFLTSTLYNHNHYKSAYYPQQIYQQNIYTHLPSYPTNVYALNQSIQQQNIQQDRISYINQQGVVRLKSLDNNKRSNYHQLGLKLPSIPQFDIMQEERKINQQKQWGKQNQKSDKCKKVCCILGWVMAGLLLLGLLTLLILLIIYKTHDRDNIVDEDNNKQLIKESDYTIGNMKPGQYSPAVIQEQQPCFEKQLLLPCSNNKKQTITAQQPQRQYIQPVDVYKKQQQQTVNKNYITYTYPPTQQQLLPQNITPHQLFYKMDHTNYPFLHLRKQLKR